MDRRFRETSEADVFVTACRRRAPFTVPVYSPTSSPIGIQYLISNKVVELLTSHTGTFFRKSCGIIRCNLSTLALRHRGFASYNSEDSVFIQILTVFDNLQ
mmetsp:Transcript_18493/g.43206  ORF Transcript_18493/g.43206 Transcript_18493/m.43206 type:complete len:101 (+) Transcript_18493:1013-1315(+)